MREQLKEETGFTDAEIGPGTPLLTPRDFANIPKDVQPLVRHWVAGPTDTEGAVLDQQLVEMDAGRDLSLLLSQAKL